jgi:hypothetical protein
MKANERFEHEGIMARQRVAPSRFVCYGLCLKSQVNKSGTEPVAVATGLVPRKYPLATASGSLLRDSSRVQK